ncbi:MAG TPA: efflux RND transporter permease subunit, partial [Saprospiraceae bacterium]|nr:efflux RND transporter permease subunit [Saprospiraceae bacterium]
AVIFGLSLMLVPVLGFSLFPESEKPIVTIDIETEPGSNLTHTDKVVRKVEQKLLSFPEIDHISANAGKGNPRIYYNEFQRQNSSNFGQIIVYLDEKTKVPEIIKFAEKARTELANFPGVRIEVKRFQQGPPITAPVEMRIIGNNLDTLDQLSAKVEKLVKARQGTMYVRNDLKYVKSDIIVDVNKEKAGLYGINGAEIAKTVRLAIAGLDISEISNTEGDEFKMKISLTQNTENALQMFDKVYVTSMSGSLLPLKNIAELSLKPSASIIRHFNKERYALVSCFAQNGINISQLTDDILNDIATQVPMPDGYRVIAAGERESSQESFGGLGTIIILTVFGLLAILILEFRTFKSTIIVLSVIPMGIIGALVALYVSGESLSFVATVGIIALMGIEIKNSILMVDYTNGLREQGMNLYDAVMDGAETRFLPILLTSMTAIGGLTPLVLENSPLISPLAIVLIGGLISSTLLSRLVTPVLYYLIPPQVK